MNKFEQTFFQKYVPEGQSIKGVIHEHWIKIVDNLLVRLGLFTFIPSFLYYYSAWIQDNVSFVFFEIYLILIFLKLIYDVFNWYNDVWIITEKGVIDLDWALLKTSSSSIKYENIEGIGVEQAGLWDKILNKGDVVIHKIGEDEFRLEDAKIPYEALDEIERISKESQQAGEDEEKDKFDLIMEALGGVVEDYLDRKGIEGSSVLKQKRLPKQREYLDKEVVFDEDAIDLR
ncbi:hypothetical protein LR004_00500 [Candidatus Gracilibacteria bacterium]|nr:hypothetical protein [Candidatus Gracilibacteria bacterium]